MELAQASALGDQAFVNAFRRRVDPLLRASGIDPRRFAVAVEHQGAHVTVSFAGPLPPAPVRQAIGVHVLGSVASLGRTVGEVDVRFAEKHEAPAD